MADGAPVLDQVEVEAMIETRRDERGEECMSLFHGCVLRNPAEPARDAKDVRVDRKRRKYG